LEKVARFPADAVVIEIAISLAIGMLVGFERESANKDVGTRTFGLTALLGTTSVLLAPAYGLAAMAGVSVGSMLMRTIWKSLPGTRWTIISALTRPSISSEQSIGQL